MPILTNNGGFLSAANGTNKVLVDTATATTADPNPTNLSVATWEITTKATPSPYYAVNQTINYLSTHNNNHAITVTVQNGPNKYTGTGLYPI